jgi:NAD(P)-dependent dehydrogenase (short-subunit alcohol dehydrogenase family)
MERLKNKVAVVTGASKGIGAAIAKHFAAEGAKVVVNYASSKEGAENLHPHWFCAQPHHSNNSIGKLNPLGKL